MKLNERKINWNGVIENVIPIRQNLIDIYMMCNQPEDDADRLGCTLAEIENKALATIEMMSMRDYEEEYIEAANPIAPYKPKQVFNFTLRDTTRYLPALIGKYSQQKIAHAQATARGLQTFQIWKDDQLVYMVQDGEIIYPDSANPIDGAPGDG